MAAIIHPTASRPTQPLHLPPPPLRLVPLVRPTRQPAAVYRRRRIVAAALLALVASVVVLSVSWVALQVWAPTPPPVPGGHPVVTQVAPGG
jgi:hypothetical protein